MITAHRKDKAEISAVQAHPISDEEIIGFPIPKSFCRSKVSLNLLQYYFYRLRSEIFQQFPN